MKYAAISFAVLAMALPGVVYAKGNTTTDVYSESITRQLSSAEVPKSFESSARKTTLAANEAPTTAAPAEYKIIAPSADSSMETAMDAGAIDTADAEDKPAEIIKAAGKKSPKKSAKRVRR